MKQQQSPARIWSIPFILVILISLLSTGIVDALQAALPVLIRHSGGSSTLGGLTVTVFALAAILPSMLAGTLADSYGCRRIMLIGAFIFLAGTLAPLLIAGIIPLLCFRIIQGIGFAFLNVTSAAGASNVLPPSRMGEGLGYFGVGQSLSMALGPMSGLALASYGSRPMWTGIVIAAFLILVLSFFCHCNREKPDGASWQRPRFTLRNMIEKRAVLPALMILIFSTGVCALIVFSGSYAQQRGYGNAGPFFIIAAGMMLLVRFASGAFMDKYSTLQILLPTMGVGMLAFLIPGLFPCRTSFYLSGACFGLSFGAAMPLLAALAVKRTPKQCWGAANATYYLCVNLGFGTGALCGGLVIDMLGFDHALCSGCLAAVVPAILGLIFLRRPQQVTE